MAEHRDTANTPMSSDAHSTLTLLMMGDSGVGKSTAINGFVLSLLYSDLTDAENAAELDFPIKSEIQVPVADTVNGGGFKIKRISTGEENNENYEKTGQSVTQFPVVHSISYDGICIDIVDTPGMNDTRGEEQNDLNIEYILAHIADLGKLDAIIILLKPDINRLSIAFVNSLKKMLSELHKDASSNIVFLITNANNCSFQPGSTIPVLQTFLNENNLAFIEVSPETVFLVDNLAVPYLIKHRGGVTGLEYERGMADNCWKASVPQLIRLLKHSSSLKPIQIDNMVAIHKAKQTIVKLSEPLLDISSCLGKNDYEIQQKLLYIEGIRKDLASANEKGSSKVSKKELLKKLAEQLKTKSYSLKSTERSHWSLICYRCATYEYGIMVPKVCQEHVTIACYPRHCQIMSWGICQRMGCSHSHKSHDITKIRYSVCVNESVSLAIFKDLEEVLESSGDVSKEMAIGLKTAELEVEKLTKKSEEYRGEQKILIQNAAKLTTFLSCYSLVKDDLMEQRVLDFFARQTDMAKANKSEEGKAVTEALENLKKEYISTLSKEKSRGTKLPLTTVHFLIQSMFSLPHSGTMLREAMNKIDKMTKSHKGVKDKVEVPPSRSNVGRFISNWNLRFS